MDEALRRIYAACDPNEPATPQYYIDCGEARGETGLARHFLNHLEGKSASEDDYLRFLFSGHIGCGKSSELEHLSSLLKNQGPFQSRFYPIFLNARDYLDDFDVALTDILLAIVTEIAATLRDEIGYELKDSYFKTRFSEIKEFFLSDVEINKGEVEAFGAKLEIQRLRRNPDARRKVRERLREREVTMSEEINRVFDEARVAIRRYQDPMGIQPYSDIVLIFDNLEKIRRFEGKEDHLAFCELFLERYAQLTGLKIHVIYTVPLRLIRSTEGPQLALRYGQEPLVLPMVKVLERESRQPYAPGVNSMQTILQRRLGGLTLKEVFDDDALEFLLRYSGGHTRNLVSFVQNACTYANKLPITLDAAKRAIQQTVRTYSTAIPESHWRKLAALELSGDQKIENGDEDYLKMLENLRALEYINGGDEDVFASAEPWYAVNPIVRELKKFKEAVENSRTPVEPPSQGILRR